jgi:hypothetical protein
VPQSQHDALPCSAGGGPYCRIADPASCPNCGGVGSLVVVIAHSRSLAYTKLNLIRRIFVGEPTYFLIPSSGDVTHRRPVSSRK